MRSGEAVSYEDCVTGLCLQEVATTCRNLAQLGRPIQDFAAEIDFTVTVSFLSKDPAG